MLLAETSFIILQLLTSQLLWMSSQLDCTKCWSFGMAKLKRHVISAFHVFYKWSCSQWIVFLHTISLCSFSFVGNFRWSIASVSHPCSAWLTDGSEGLKRVMEGGCQGHHWCWRCNLLLKFQGTSQHLLAGWSLKSVDLFPRVLERSQRFVVGPLLGSACS